MNYKELLPFCSNDYSRISIQVPIQIGDWLYATDGHICVRAQRVKVPDGFGKEPPKGMSAWPNPEKSVTDGLTRFFETEPTGFRRVVHVPRQNPQVECDACMGEGGFQCEACDHPNECRACGGDGFNIEDIYLDLGGVCMSTNLLHRILHFHYLEIALNPSEPLKGQRFRFQGGEGIIMPLKRVEDETYVPADLFAAEAQPGERTRGGAT